MNGIHVFAIMSLVSIQEIVILLSKVVIGLEKHGEGALWYLGGGVVHMLVIKILKYP